jgi:mono/diheme cytochrome c family protein
MRKVIVMGVLALSLAFAGSAIASDGAALFKSKCSACHGPDGAGTAMAPGFTGNEFIKTSEAGVIAETIKNGRVGDQKKYKQFVLAMPAQKGALSDDEISAVITYLKSLAK